MSYTLQSVSNRGFKTSGTLLNFLLGLFFLLTTCACRELGNFSYDFEKEADLEKITWKCGTVLSLTDNFVTSGGKSLQVEMYPPTSGSQNRYPGVYFMRFNGDWSLQKSLLLDITNPADQPLPVTIRIDDAKNLPYDDRYNGKFQINPGSNHIRLPFENMITTKTGRLLNTKHIAGVMIYLVNPSEKHTLYFDNFRLE